MTTNTSTRKPPASAVAKDAHWAKTMARLEKLKPATATFTICDDPDIKQTLTKARARLDATQATLDALDTDSDPDARQFTERRRDDAQTALNEAQKAFDKTAIRLTFRALSRAELEHLQAAHPPTEEQEKDGAGWNADTFPAALISAASIDGMPVDYAQHLLDTWSAGDSLALWTAAWSVQQQPRTDLGKG